MGLSICLNRFMFLMGLDKGNIKSILVAHLDDLSLELNNIEESCYVGEVMLNHLTFADDICVFCPCVCELQSILDVFQAYAESHGIFFNCSKTICMTFNMFTACVQMYHTFENTQWATIFVPLCNSVTCQSIVLESCSNP